MRFIYVFVVFFTTTGFVARAQNKPTREETISFITTTLKGTHDTKSQVTDVLISVTDKTMIIKYGVEGENLSAVSIYSGVRFEDINKIVTETTRLQNDYILLSIIFKHNYISAKGIAWVDGEKEELTTNNINSISVAVPQDKVASITKAFLRLKEIEHENNPFKD